jgi:tetratricopeptide (TPR) repeat protein
VKDRVLSTFQQTVVLFKQGRNDEVSAGCNLLLQMDPMFEPARKLLEKLRNPALPIDVEQLVPLERTGPSPMEQARAAMAARDFERVVQLTSEILTNDLFNDEARVLGDDAREKLEAGPFIDQFTRKADQHLAAGNAVAAKAEVEKARSLDPTHPDVVRVTRALADAPPAPRAQPSFVVDDAAASGSGAGRTTHAADFGFTFEEEKPAEEKPAEVSFTNFSFDSPAAETPFGGFSFDAQPGGHAAAAPAPPRAPASTEHFDFATASVSASDEDQKKIDQYLSDGDRAFDSGDYSQAIDLWSRIFLIDVTNDQASERIERAKAKRRELEQKAEAMLTSAVAAFDRGDKAAARAELTEILHLDPRNATAQDYLDRIEESPAAAGATGQPMVPPPAEKDDIFDDDFGAFGGASSTRAAVPAPAARDAKPKPVPVVAPGRRLPTRLIAIVVALLVLGAGGWYAWSKFSGDTETESTGAGQALIARATMLANHGRYDQAIALLRDIQPGDPAHDKALVLIADLQQKKSTSAALIDGVPAGQYFDQKIAAAKAALAANDFSAAKAAFEQAIRVRPLPPDLKAQYDIAAQQASKLDASRALFAERKYLDALASLEPLRAQDPGNLSIQRMIADAHFNLGAMALQEERIPDAIREFDETLKTNPQDELARRSRDLAVRYKDEQKDLLYKIYVKYLPLRQAT